MEIARNGSFGSGLAYCVILGSIPKMVLTETRDQYDETSELRITMKPSLIAKDFVVLELPWCKAAKKNHWLLPLSLTDVKDAYITTTPYLSERCLGIIEPTDPKYSHILQHLEDKREHIKINIDDIIQNMRRAL